MLATVALFCALLLAIRFVVYPRIESHQADIAAMVSREVGQPVEIDTIRTGWDGWSPRLVVEGLRIRDERDPALPPLIELPRATGVVSWTSLLTADIRLKELVVDGPRLAFRRDREGRLHVGGFALGEDDGRPADTRLTDWLLRQRAVVVRNAMIGWSDERLDAPQLVLADVHFRLENHLGRHRFGLRGTPPPELASPLDVRGELGARSFTDWRRTAGRLYLRLDYADLAAWSTWLPLDAPIQNGEGALRTWLTFEDGAPVHAVADVELEGLRTRLANDLDLLELDRLSGRITWHRDGAQRTLALRDVAIARGGTVTEPGEVVLRYARGEDGTTTDGRFIAPKVDLQALTTIASQLPLPAAVRTSIAAHAPRGELSNIDYAWTGAWRSPSGFRASADVAGLAVRAHDGMPGLAGWSGRVEVDEHGGRVELAARDATIEMPEVFAQALQVSSADGQVRWERDDRQWRVQIDRFAFRNADAMGTLRGSWHSLAEGPGEVDLDARFTRVEGRELHRYVPKVLGDDLRVWLRDSLLAGSSDDARVVIKGDLAQFPFADGASGTFIVTANASGATLDYATGWPRLERLDGHVRFERNRMSVVATRGEMLGVPLARVSASIDDLLVQYPLLVVDGEASAATSQFLDFVRGTPVAERIGHATDGIAATGNGRLTLRLALPVGEPDAVARVSGDYQFIDNQLRLPDVPPLAGVNGRVTFTERSASASDVSVEALGGAAKIAFTSEGGGLQVSGTGTASLAAVHEAFGTPMPERFAGTTDWHYRYERGDRGVRWRIESSLRGVAVDLPVPLAKRPSEAAPLAIERRLAPHDATRDTVVVEIGSDLRAVVQRRLAPEGAKLDRAVLLVGKAARTQAEPDRAGVVVRGDLPSLDVDAWLALARSRGGETGGQATDGPQLELADVDAGEFVVFGRVFNDMKLRAQRDAARWRFDFRSRQADGQAQWEAAHPKFANGRITARLTRLDYAAIGEPAAGAGDAEVRHAGSKNTWPEIDLQAERLLGRPGPLGRLEFAARPDGTDWTITRFALVNDAGRIDAKGTWRLVGVTQHTDLDVSIDVQNASDFLAQFALPHELRGAPARLVGHLGWPGSPGDFAFAKLSGRFDVKVGAGQFTKMDPGVGKLLGVLSLQALPRRISLDFRDVFSEGFAFDAIAGTVAIHNGVMRTEDLQVSGPAAKVMLVGDVDLEKETQRLTVRVQPSLSTVISTGAGAAAVALLAANPLVGAAVGAGTLIAQRIMQDPIEQIFSYEYAVSGSWSDPLVERSRSPVLPRLGDARPARGAPAADAAAPPNAAPATTAPAASTP